MAVRHRLIRERPDVVWAIISDAGRYDEWVVGPAKSEPSGGHWPEVGASLRYEINLSGLKLHNHTTVRRMEPGRVLELEANSGPLGTARIAIEVRPWGEHTLVIFDEHPLRGPGGTLHNVFVDVLQQARHRAMLGRLARVCEHRPSNRGR